MEQFSDPQQFADTLTWLTTGGGAILTGIVIWLIKRFLDQVDKLNNRIDELEKEVLVLQVKGGMEQTQFTGRTKVKR